MKKVSPPSRYSADRSKAVPLLQSSLLVRLCCHTWHLFVTVSSSSLLLIKAVLRDCGISWVSSHILINHNLYC